MYAYTHTHTQRNTRVSDSTALGRVKRHNTSWICKLRYFCRPLGALLHLKLVVARQPIYGGLMESVDLGMNYSCAIKSRWISPGAFVYNSLCAMNSLCFICFNYHLLFGIPET